MSLNYIFVDGFRNVKNTKIEFAKITSLLSINSYGKSNLLNAFDFGFEFLSETSKNKKSMMGYKRGIPLSLSNLYSDFTFEFGLDVDINKKQYEIIYGYSFQWNVAKKKGSIISEFLKVKESGESHKFSLYIDRNIDKAFYKPSITSRCDKDIKIENNELVINKILAFDGLFYIDVVKYLNNVSMYIDRHLDSSDSFIPSPVIFKGSDEFDLVNQSDIARILYRLKIKHKEKYDLIINTVMDIFPFILGIEVREVTLNPENVKSNIGDVAPFEISDKIYTLYANHKNMKNKLSFKSMSDGVKRVLLLYTFTVLAQLNNTLLIAIEEPENSINPGLLKKFLIGLDNFIDKSRVVITSHSPFLINYVNPDNLYLGIPNLEYNALFRKFKQNSLSKLINQARDNEMMVGEYIFDLMNGTHDDCDELCRYLENE